MENLNWENIGYKNLASNLVNFNGNEIFETRFNRNSLYSEEHTDMLNYFKNFQVLDSEPYDTSLPWTNESENAKEDNAIHYLRASNFSN